MCAQSINYSKGRIQGENHLEIMDKIEKKFEKLRKNCEKMRKIKKNIKTMNEKCSKKV